MDDSRDQPVYPADTHAHRNSAGRPYLHAHAYSQPHRHSDTYPSCFPDAKRDHIWDAIFDTQARRDAATHERGGPTLIA